MKLFIFTIFVSTLVVSGYALKCIRCSSEDGKWGWLGCAGTVTDDVTETETEMCGDFENGRPDDPLWQCIVVFRDYIAEDEDEQDKYWWNRGCCYGEDCKHEYEEDPDLVKYWKTCSTDMCNTMDPRNGGMKIPAYGWMLSAITAVVITQINLKM